MWYPKNKIPLREVKRFVVVFYIVGVVGFGLKISQDIFQSLTAYSLLLCLYLLAVYHENYTRKELGVFLLIYLLGFGVELLGVNTGLIFGNYNYGDGLGFKVLGTPLMIGVNWLFLIYCIGVVIHKIKVHWLIKSFLGAGLMVIYDLVLEHVAAFMDMWYWKTTSIPVQNYVAWFLISLVLFGLLFASKVKLQNSLAAVLLSSQFTFLFLLLFIQYV